MMLSREEEKSENHLFKYTYFLKVNYCGQPLLWQYSETKNEARANSLWIENQSLEIGQELDLALLNIGCHTKEHQQAIGIRKSTNGKEFVIDDFVSFVIQHQLHIQDIIPGKPRRVTSIKDKSSLKRQSRLQAVPALTSLSLGRLPLSVTDTSLGLFKKTSDHPLISPRKERSYHGILLDELASYNRKIAKIMSYETLYTKKKNRVAAQFSCGLIISESGLIKRKKALLSLTILELKKARMLLLKEILVYLNSSLLVSVPRIGFARMIEIIKYFEAASLALFKKGSLEKFLDHEKQALLAKEEQGRLSQINKELITASKALEQCRINQLLEKFTLDLLPDELRAEIDEEVYGAFIKRLKDNLQQTGHHLRANKRNFSAYQKEVAKHEADYVSLERLVVDIIPEQHKRLQKHSPRSPRGQQPLTVAQLLIAKLSQAIISLHQIDQEQAAAGSKKKSFTSLSDLPFTVFINVKSVNETIYIRRKNEKSLVEKIKNKITSFDTHKKDKKLGWYLDQVKESKWLDIIHTWLLDSSDEYKKKVHQEQDQGQDLEHHEGEKNDGSRIKLQSLVS